MFLRQSYALRTLVASNSLWRTPHMWLSLTVSTYNSPHTPTRNPAEPTKRSHGSLRSACSRCLSRGTCRVTQPRSCRWTNLYQCTARRPLPYLVTTCHVPLCNKRIQNKKSTVTGIILGLPRGRWKCGSGKCRSGKYRSENVWKAVKAENKLYH